MISKNGYFPGGMLVNFRCIFTDNYEKYAQGVEYSDYRGNAAGLQEGDGDFSEERKGGRENQAAFVGFY